LAGYGARTADLAATLNNQFKATHDEFARRFPKTFGALGGPGRAGYGLRLYRTHRFCYPQ
jgi:hypothetical protein